MIYHRIQKSGMGGKRRWASSGMYDHQHSRQLVAGGPLHGGICYIWHISTAVAMISRVFNIIIERFKMISCVFNNFRSFQIISRVVNNSRSFQMIACVFNNYPCLQINFS